MEEFTNLNWSWKNQQSTSNLYQTNFSDNENDIFFCHINEIDPIHLLDNYGRNNSCTETTIKDPRTGKEITKEIIYHTTFKGKLYNFSQKSSMNSNEHQSCLNAVLKLKDNPVNLSLSDRQDIRLYERLKQTRIKEKSEFLLFVEGEFYRRNINKCYDLRPELDKFVTKWWQHSIDDRLKLNDNYYVLQSAVPIATESIGDDKLRIQFEKTIAKSGIVLVVDRTKYTEPTHLSCSFLEHFFPHDSVDFVDPPEELSVDIVISLKTLTFLLASVKNKSIDWDLTFSMKQDGNQQVIVFDEVLPPKTLECLEKNRRAYKYALTALTATRDTVFCFEKNDFVERPPQLDDPPSGTCEPPPTYKLCGFDDYLKKFSSHIELPTNKRSADTNHIQRLWNIQRNGVNCCRLLIHNRQDFCEKQNDGSVKFINLSPKIEYQYDFGAEQMTLSELIKEWCELRFGPDTVTDRARIEIKSGSVLDTKEIKLADVEHDLERLYKVKMESLMESVLNLLNIFKRFPVNDYLLRHEAKHCEQAMVYVKSNESRSSKNIIQVADIYKSKCDPKPILWNPIDDTVCTTVHKLSSVMPCAFPHWGWKTHFQPNDREKVLKRAERKTKAKLDAATERTALFKKIQKSRRVKRKRQERLEKKRKIKATKLPLEGECIDPIDLFDEQGNVHLFTLSQQDLSKDNDQISTEDINQPVDALCYETYCRDAAILSESD